MPPWLPYLLSPITALIVWYVQTQSTRGVTRLDKENEARDKRLEKAEERIASLERENATVKSENASFRREQDRMRDTLHDLSEKVQTHSGELRQMGRSRAG